MKSTLLLLFLVVHITSVFAHVKFSEAERTIIRLQDERRGIDTIAHFLFSKDEKVVWRAAIALANIHDTSSRTALRTALARENREEAKNGIAFALGVLGPDEESYIALKAASASKEVFIALGRTVPKDSREDLNQYLQNPGLPAQYVASALVEIGLRKLLNESSAKLADELEKNPDPEIRWQAIYAYGRTDDSALLNNHLSAIKECLSDIGSPEARMFAATALGKIHNSDAEKILVDGARSETQWRVQVNIINALGKMPRLTSAIYSVLKNAVDRSQADSAITGHIATAALDVVDGMIESGKFASPDSETVGEWLSEYAAGRDMHTEQSEDIHSRAMIPYTRLAGLSKEKYKGVAGYLSPDFHTSFINACHAVGLVPDSIGFFVLTRELIKVGENDAPFVLDGLHLSWEIAKKNPSYYASLERERFAATYRQLLMQFPTQTDNVAIVSRTMDALADPLIVTDSLRPEAEKYLLEYLGKFESVRYQDRLLPVLSAVKWLKPKTEAFAEKITEIMNTSATVWGNKQIADTSYEILRAMGKTVSPPDVHIIRGPIDWNQIERLPDTMILQSKYGFIYIKMNTYEAPLSALNLYTLSKESYFVFNYIHRLVPNFVIQSGDMTGTGDGGPGYSIRTEIAPLRYDSLGVCGMASDGKDTEGSQWFITHCPTPHLNTRYTIWGSVVRGKEIIEKLQWNDKIENLIPYR